MPRRKKKRETGKFESEIKKKILEQIGERQPSQMGKSSVEELVRKIEEGGTLSKLDPLYIMKLAKALAKKDRARANQLLKHAGLPPLRTHRELKKSRRKNPEEPEK